MFSGEVPVKIGTFLYSFIGLLKNVHSTFLLWHVDQLIGDCTEAVVRQRPANNKRGIVLSDRSV
jgi:hypothetical protein